MKQLRILHLYPREMNLYGDHGNILALKRRCEWRGMKAEVIPLEPGAALPDGIDIIFGGGGQDSGQSRIEQDLLSRKEQIRTLVEQGTPALVICGLYQLFGKGFRTNEGQYIRGIDVFPIETEAGPERLVGNITIMSEDLGEIAGFENHSGLTFLKGCAPLGTVIRGQGNNGKDRTEGARYKNCIGTYLHGPVLPKNPRLADHLILTALRRKDPSLSALSSLDDSAEEAAHASAASRPR